MLDRDSIKKEFEAIRESGIYDISDRHLFSIWSLAVFHYQSDFSEPTINEIYDKTYRLLQDGDPGDFCLDGFHYDEDLRKLYLYQTKWPDSETKQSTVGNADDVANALTFLYNHLMEGIELNNEPRELAVRCLKEVIEDNGQIELCGVIGSKWNNNHLKRVEHSIPHKLKNITEVKLYGLKEISHFLSNQKKDLKGVNVLFKFYEGTKDPILHYPDQGVKGIGESVVIMLSGLGLASITKEHEDRLFDVNVRLYLGSNRRNKSMENSIKDESELSFFWYGHNGITILCDDYEPKNYEELQSEITVYNPQIVNGCQTANTLKEVFGSSAKNINDFPILTKIIMLTGDDDNRSDIAEDIAYRTNNQSAIQDADLCANEPTQKEFQKMCESFDKKWFYERKRGEWKNLRKTNPFMIKKFQKTGTYKRLIEREAYQQAWRSYIGEPAHAISSKGEVWLRTKGAGKDLYSRVFNSSRRPCDIVLVTTLFDWFLQVFYVTKDNTSLCFDIRKGLHRHAQSVKSARNLLAAHAVALFGYLVKKKYGDVDKYPVEHATKIINTLRRGSYVKSKWTKSGNSKSWHILEDAVPLIFLTIQMYIQEVGTSKTLTSALRLNDEKALKIMLEICDDEYVEDTDYVEPK